MRGALVALGALTLGAGVLNVPPLFGGSWTLARWLAPVTDGPARWQAQPELPAATEWALVLGTGVLAVLGTLAAWRLLRPEGRVPARLAPPERGLGRLLWKKWYVDE